MIFIIELKFGRSVTNVDRQFVIARITTPTALEFYNRQYSSEIMKLINH